MNIKLTILITLCLGIIAVTTNAQPITGTTPVVVNDTETYSITTTVTPLGNFWEATGGDVLSTTENNTTNEYTATIKWTSSGTQTITFSSFGGTIATKDIEVGALPNKPPTPTASTNNCSAKILTRNGTVPSGETWYWQTSSTGTSQSIGSGLTHNVTASGTYYIRPKNSFGWGTASDGVSVTVNMPPDTPTTPTSSSNTCGDKTLSRSNPPSGVTWYWQTTSDGTSTANSGATYNAGSTGTYYLRARSSAGCWSGLSASIAVTVNSTPAVPSTPGVDNQCGQSVLTRTTPPSGITWYWQSSAGGTSTSNSNASITLQSGNTYYIRARSSAGCWSDARTVNYSIKAVPSIPTGPLVDNQCGQSVLTKNAAPSGTTWYWQSSANGTSTANSNASITRTSGSTYYLRARNNTSLCWSDAFTVNYSILNVPSNPATPTISSNNCGEKTLTRNAPPSGTTWYWQSTANGTNTSSSGATYPVNTTGTYYLRAKDNSTGCWSNDVSVSVTVNSIPSDPPTPSVSTNTCGDKTLTRGTPPSGVTWYWQSSSTGTSTSNSSVTKSLSSSTVYYLRAQNNTSGCWSAGHGVVNVTVNPVPNIPSVPTISSNNCGDKTLTKIVSPPGITWYWQTTANGTNTSSSSSTYTASSDGTYYLRAQDDVSGCWSSDVSVSVDVNEIPADPPSPSISSNTCGDKVLTRATPPAGVTWYWHSSATGTSTSNSSVTKTISSSTTYYLRAQNNASGCWSSGNGIAYVTVNPIPSIPDAPTISTNTCGDKILTRGTPPPGTTWYWHTGPNGTSTSNVSVNYTVSSSGTFYLRAQVDATGCWSDDQVIPVNVIDYPSTPAQPTVSTNDCGPKTLSRVSSPPTGETWYWQTSSSGESTTLGSANQLVVSNAGTYFLKSQNSSGCWGTASIGGIVAFNDPLDAGSISGESTICANEVPDAIVNNESPTGENSVYSYLWEQSSNGTSNWVPADGTNDQADYSPGTLTSTTYYRRVVTSCSVADITDPVTITVNDLPTVDAGSAEDLFEGNITLLDDATPTGGIWSGTGTSGNYFYAESAGVGSHSIMYSYTEPGTGCSNSDNKDITVNANPVITNSGANLITFGESRQLSVPSGFTAYQWFRNSALITGANSETYTAMSPGHYRVSITNSSGISISTANVILVSELTNQTENYVITSTMQVPVQNEENLYGMPSSDKAVNVTYYDGLARKKQTVHWQASPQSTDIVQPLEYDEFGRVSDEYLPYAASVNGAKYKSQAIVNGAAAGSEQYDFYQSTEKVTGDTRPFNENIYEQSPLNRVVEQFGPGQDWKDNDKSITYKYQIFRDTYDVKSWVLSGDLPVLGTPYTTGDLTLTITHDEEDHYVKEFTDKRGLTVLKRVDSGNGAYADTYYVYDDYNLLRIVMPPMMVEEMNSTSNFAPNQDMLERWAFQYKYDNRFRMIEKRVPGAGWLYMVYDSRDRLVLTQDANQRVDDEWTFTKYDVFNRPILTGLTTITENVTSVRNDVKNSAVFYEQPGTDVLGYTNNAYPPELSENNYLNVTYYDNYDFLNGTHWQDKSYNFTNPDELSSIQTDGTSQYIALNQYYDSNGQIPEITIEAWINTDYVHPTGSYNANWAIIDFDRSEYFTLFVHGGNGKLGFSTTGAQHDIDDFYSDIVVNDGQWHHVAVVYDGTDKIIYIDGVEDRRKASPHNGANLGTGDVRYGFIGDGSEAISYNGSRNNRYFQGQIGEVRLWHGVRSATEISNNQNVPLTGNETGLVGFWNMSAGSGTDLEDQTGNGHDGELINSNGNSWMSELKPGGEQLIASMNVKGQVTGSMSKNLKDGNWIKAANYYDSRYRPIQIVGNNNLNGRSVNTSFYDFTGKVTRQVNLTDDDINAVMTTRSFSYDHVGRVTEITHQINDGPVINLLKNEYNEIGELVDKKLHSSNGTDFRQSIDYRYNVRGWLKHINDPHLMVSALNDDENDFFGMSLYYNDETGYNTPAWNGNVTGNMWSDFAGNGTVLRKGYSYEYDAMNRLTSAQSFDLTATNITYEDARSVPGIEYDLNGNITSLLRKALDGSDLDSLTYIYSNGSSKSNQLIKVTDASGNMDGFVDGADLNEEYIYDGNGNMITDKNKGILQIDYNYLNLPDRIEMDNGDYIEYAYDANGNKMQQKVYQNSSLVKTTDYIDEHIYENGSLQLIQHEEGRIIPELDGSMTYQYHMKDHLGNVRLTFSSNPGQYNYLATMETEYATEEDQEFYNMQTRWTSTAANTTPAGNEVAMLNETQPIGPGMQLSVNRADTIRAEVNAYYEDNSGFSTVLSPAEMIAAVASAFGGTQGAGGEAGQIFDGINEAIGGLMGVGGSNGDNIPAAYLSYIILNKEYGFEDGGYIPISVAANTNPELLILPPIVINKPGILYVYVSNESSSLNPVYFDDLKVTVSESPVLETTDYYPFGLAINNYKKPGMVNQNYLYQDKELQQMIEVYDFTFRTYDPVLGRTWQGDPRADLFYEYSPYSWALGNPISIIDPTGMIAFRGDFYGENGKKLGTDGNDDGKVYVVSDKKEAKAISKTDKAGGTTQVSEVSSATELPSANVREQMGKSVDRSNKPNESVGDSEGGFHEEGGIYGKTNGEEKVIDAQPGPYKDPREGGHAEVDAFSGETADNYLEEVEGTFHVHPKGEIVARPGANTIGGEKRTANFGQPPSDQDLKNAATSGRTGNNFVFGARSGKVYIYNSTGKIVTFPLKEFRSIGIKKK